jgi:hypothetical protein
MLAECTCGFSQTLLASRHHPNHAAVSLRKSLQSGPPAATLVRKDQRPTTDVADAIFYLLLVQAAAGGEESPVFSVNITIILQLWVPERTSPRIRCYFPRLHPTYLSTFPLLRLQMFTHTALKDHQTTTHL